MEPPLHVYITLCYRPEDASDLDSSSEARPPKPRNRPSEARLGPSPTRLQRRFDATGAAPTNSYPRTATAPPIPTLPLLKGEREGGGALPAREGGGGAGCSFYTRAFLHGKEVEVLVASFGFQRGQTTWLHWNEQKEMPSIDPTFAGGGKLLNRKDFGVLVRLVDDMEEDLPLHSHTLVDDMDPPVDQRVRDRIREESVRDRSRSRKMLELPRCKEHENGVCRHGVSCRYAHEGLSCCDVLRDRK